MNSSGIPTETTFFWYLFATVHGTIRYSFLPYLERYWLSADHVGQYNRYVRDSSIGFSSKFLSSTHFDQIYSGCPPWYISVYRLRCSLEGFQGVSHPSLGQWHPLFSLVLLLPCCVLRVGGCSGSAGWKNCWVSGNL